MTKKRKLSDLVATETQRKEPLSEPTEPESDIEPQPKYLTLVRKEARLTELQIEQLTAISRKLNRQGLVIATEKFGSVRRKSLQIKASLAVLIDKPTISSTCSTVPI